MNYSRTETHEGNDCLITKNAHIVQVYRNGSTAGYVATRSTIYYGWFGLNSKSESCVFDGLAEAKEYCEEYFEERKDLD